MEISISFGELRGHRAAGFGTGSAGFDAFVHAANFLTTVCTGPADFSTGFAIQGVVVGISRHEVNTCGTSGNAIEHQFDVLLPCVVPSFFQAVFAERLGTGYLTLVAILDTGLVGSCCLGHRFLLFCFISLSKPFTQPLAFRRKRHTVWGYPV